MRSHLFTQAVTIAAVAALATTADAQQSPARSFDQLQALAKPGDTVTVTDSMGRETTGKIAGLSMTTIALMDHAQKRELRESDVMKISQRRRDSLVNGAIWGAAIAGGLSLIAANQCANDFSCRDWGAGWVALGFGLGAGIGSGVDAAISTRHVIYERPPTVAARISVFPVDPNPRAAAAATAGWHGSPRMVYGWEHVTASPPQAIGARDLVANWTRRFELFGGYSHVEPAHGAAASFDWNMRRHVGLAIDWDVHGWTAESRTFSDGSYVSEEDLAVMFLSVGPRFVFRSGRISPFGTVTVDAQSSHFGGYTFVNPAYPDYHGGDSGHRSDAYGLGFGGGADFDINERFAVRMVQINYFLGGFGSGLGVQFRLKTGVVYKFGPPLE